MKEIDNLLTVTKRMHSALEAKKPEMIDTACVDLIAAIRELEAQGVNKITSSDRPAIREILSISEENERLAKEGATEVAALLTGIKFNHR